MLKSAAHNLAQKSWIRAAIRTWRKIFKSFWFPDYYENIVENAADPDEEKELEREGHSEETENGSKGIEKLKADEETI